MKSPPIFQCLIFGVCGGLSDLRMSYKYYCNKKKKKPHKQIFFSANAAQMIETFCQCFALGGGQLLAVLKMLLNLFSKFC